MSVASLQRYIKHKRDETLGLDVGEEEDDEFDMLPQKSEVEYEVLLFCFWV